MSGGKYVDMGR